MATRIRRYLSLLILLLAPASATALIIDIDARWEYWNYNYLPILFDAGTYQITPIGIADGGKFDAWNAWGWGATTDCNALGVCSRGYLNSYSFGRIGEHNFVYEIATAGGLMSDGTALAYATPALALSHATSYTFSITEPTQLYFYVRDGETWYSDNAGGMSLNVSPIPEPGIASMLLAALMPVAFLARLRRDGQLGASRFRLFHRS
jgi:hypothetical protein